MNNAMFQSSDGPVQKPIHRARHVEIEFGEFSPEGIKIKCRRDGALLHSRSSGG
jgi:hypothetical protein